MAGKSLHKPTKDNKTTKGSNIEVGDINVGGDVYGDIVVGHGNIINRITNFFQGDTKAQIERRNRRVMLDHVENFWVKGVLEKSLHGAALLELGIKEDQGAVNYPWTIKKESTDETLPSGKSMLEIFKEIGMGRSLLILGAPGSGKTTMLLELARQLIQRAREDETEPIPVVFNLASWKENQTLSDWLLEQFDVFYRVPNKTAAAWVNENHILLLLDGLDEVKKDSRVKCIETINKFRKEFGLTPLVVCSRIEEYSVLKGKLSLEGAITLQPLTIKQSNAYIDQFGNSLASVKVLLNQDKILQELAETPLVLSIIALAYKDRKFDELVISGNLKNQRKHLFNTYIIQMFERSASSKNVPFTNTQTLRYLGWLARKMIQDNIITYQIESMQPSWLEQQLQRRLYELSFRLSVGLIGGLVFGFMVAVSAERSVGLILGLIFLLFFVLIFGWRVGPTDKIMMVGRLRWSWNAARRGLIDGLGEGLILGLRIGLIIGMLIELLSGLSGGLIDILMRALANTLFSVLFCGLILGLSSGVIDGLKFEQIEETYYPGQRLKQTFFSSLLATLSYGVVFGLIFGLGFGPILGLTFGMTFALIFGLAFGVSIGMIQGYIPQIQYYSLRLVMARYDLLPGQLIPFLEYAVSLIFLRRVGGSYIFVHRLLMEHFAEMEETPPYPPLKGRET